MQGRGKPDDQHFETLLSQYILLQDFMKNFADILQTKNGNGV